MGIRAETTGFPCREFFRQRDEDYALAEAKTGPEGKDRHSEELRKAAIRSATSGLWNSLNVSDCGLITRTPSRLLLRIRRGVLLEHSRCVRPTLALPGAKLNVVSARNDSIVNTSFINRPMRPALFTNRKRGLHKL